MRSFASLFFVLFLLTPKLLHAHDGAVKQYVKTFNLKKTPVAVIIVGYTKDAEQVGKLLELTTNYAREIRTELDPENSKGELGLFNAKHDGKPREVSKLLLTIFKAGKKTAEWSSGAVDITLPSSMGSYRDIEINEDASKVQLKQKEMRVDFAPVADGFLADILIRYIYAAGMKNAMVKVGTVFRGLGQSTHGPWKVQVQDVAGTYAHRAINMALGNAGFATISAASYRSKQLIDPRTKQKIPITCRGVTVAMTEAALAQGIANAIFVLGPQKGFKLLKKLDGVRGLIVDNSGKFLRSEGF